MDAKAKDSRELDGVSLWPGRPDAEHDGTKQLTLFWRDDVCMMQQLPRQRPTFSVDDVDGHAAKPPVDRQGNDARDSDAHGVHRASRPERFGAHIYYNLARNGIDFGSWRGRFNDSLPEI